MTNKAYAIIVLFMCLAVAGIIGIQLLWLNNLVGFSEIELGHKTDEALIAAVNKLQKKEYIKAINTDFESIVDSLYRNNKNKKEGVLIFREKIHGTITDTTFILDKNTKNAIQHEISSKTFIKITSQNKPNFINTQIEKKIGEKVKNVESIVKQMILETKPKSVFSRLNFDSLKIILQSELKHRGIDLNFEYAVSENQELKKSNKYLLLNGTKEFKTKLFPEDISPQNSYLLLYYTNNYNYIFSKLKGLLILSVVFTLFIIVIFFVSIKTLFKQKKLGEIKNDFINNMTHEFKTPIATISIATEAMNNPKVRFDDEKYKYYTGILKEENDKLNKHVERVLQIALIDKGKLKIALQPVNIHSIIEQSIQNYQLVITSCSAKVETNFQAINPIIFGDELHLLHAINNLLDNAIKYNTSQVRISIQTTEVNNFLVVKIIDNGIGMSKDVIKNVFEKFYRAQKGNIHNVKGFGLGLSYVKNIMNLHKGEIEIESEEGRGSIFSLKFNLNTHE